MSANRVIIAIYASVVLLPIILFPFVDSFPILSTRRNRGRLHKLSGSTTDASLEMVESIIVNEVNDESNVDKNKAISALNRAVEIGNILGGQVFAPILTSLVVNQDNWPTEENGGWEKFWSTSTDGISHAQRLVMALEDLGPTCVKFGQALGSRPDVVPTSLAAALCTLQDEMQPFDSDLAKDIIVSELMGYDGGGESASSISLQNVEALIESLTDVPVAAASIGQVYKAKLPGKGDVAVKVQRPGVRKLVERDTELLLTLATFLESLPALPSQRSDNDGSSSSTAPTNKPARLINTQLVSATQEFMSRIFEELDYRNEAANIEKFANLYSEYNGSSPDVSVIVPQVYLDWCTENVLVMEWIDGSKLTDVQTAGKSKDKNAQDSTEENLALVKVAIDSTLSQLLITGILHADPHAGNLLKVQRDDGTVTLGYLDFGLLSTIPEQVRDALICSVALQVFERDVDAVSALFGELRLIPQHILDDEKERTALAEALHITFENSLLYPEPTISSSGEEITAIPDLKFDKLLDSLSRLVPRFQFDLPPYFINNARALSTLEGIAKSLDPSFNVLTIMYPYALNRLLLDPNKTPVVERTLQTLIRSSDGKIDRQKIKRLLRDSAMISGLSKRRVIWDIIRSSPGRKLTRSIVREDLKDSWARRRKRSML